MADQIIAGGFRIVVDPVSDSVRLSAIFAVLPLLTLFLLLGVFRVRAWLAGVISLVVALVVAIAGYAMPVGQALLSASEGAAFGFFPILWIVINAIWVYNLTVVSGHFDVLRRSMERVSPDMRIQAIIVAFCFGALLEALAGFGTPVAVTVVMLTALGFAPIRAASVALIANTAPVAFGALATPIVTLATVTSGAGNDPRLTTDTLGAMVGRQTPVLALVVPLILVFVVDGRRGVRQAWPAAAVAGLVFAVAQFVASNHLSVPLTDIVASLAAAAAVVLLLRLWQPARAVGSSPLTGAAARRDASAGDGALTGTVARRDASAGDGALTGTVARRDASAGDGALTGTVARRDASAGEGPPTGTAQRRDVAVEGSLLSGTGLRRDAPAEVARAYAPYLIIIVIFAIANLGPVKSALARSPWTVIFAWPGLHVLSATGKPLSSTNFTLGWLPAAGTLLIIAGILSAVVLRVRPGAAARAYGRTYAELRQPIVTVMAVLALAYVLNQSGQTNTLGAFLATAGGVFVFLSPILGWIGVAVTGSDTSANALFGALQVQTAAKAGLDPLLLAAANSSGGVLGKMVSPQNLAIAAGAVGMAGREGDIFRKVILWSAVLLLGMCVLVTLQSTPILGWMIPG
ncbi:lactate transporter LctP family protein [Actinoplanes sp. SE50]|uniref:L-lactate permease n=1 Tax=unclassified Actinoplanes TaxID=2626549 RepID=UPI00023ED220|nr:MULTISPECIES: L-lactate permease [unclassified Actinoplanes]AEV83889.1 L-lactate permease [Actinoplanes sp. SE50/110]ATO81967.1 lactate transporter LctP family protein [Actinoplanes sp. SE50]SLL99375.1 lactate transporter LctP family protein [Actinoplanes sp. SE50/110]